MTKPLPLKFQDTTQTSRELITGSLMVSELRDGRNIVVPVADSVGENGFPISSSISLMRFGERGIDSKENFTSSDTASDTLFCAGSMTKMITAATMLRMTEEEKYRESLPEGIDTKLSTILPILKKHYPHSTYITKELEKQPNFEDITLAHLAQHISGLSNFSASDLIGEVYDSANRSIPRDMLDAKKASRTGRRAETIGEHSYNNLGYELLGRVIVSIAREVDPLKEFGDVVNEILIDRVREKIGPEKALNFFTAD